MRFLTALAPARPAAQAIAHAPESTAFAPIRESVRAVAARHELLGAVILIGGGDEAVQRQVFGPRAVQPSPEPTTEGTIFNLASPTKVVATTTSVTQRVEEGRNPTDRAGA